MATYNITQSVPDPAVLEVGDILICPYSGTINYCTLPKGIYKLEAWGARGGSIYMEKKARTSSGGRGGYTTGKIRLSAQTSLFCVSGGAGANYTIGKTTHAGGLNGGGNGLGYDGNSTRAVAGGGGCSHIATAVGLLSALSSNRESVLIVAGGAGGGGVSYSDTDGYGGYGGGLTGGDSGYYTVSPGRGGTQSSGGGGQSQYGCAGFGQGAYNERGGGGGGWYGGGPGYWVKSTSAHQHAGGGGGSSYYNTSLLTEYSTIAGNASMPAPGGGTETGHNDNGYIKITIIEIEASIPLLVNIAGTYKQVINAYVNVNGAWKDVTDIKTNVGGTWK